MFLPKYFKVEDQNTINDFIRRNPFATMSTAVDGKLQANHLPLQLKTDSDNKPSILLGHIARANPLVKLVTSPTDCLVIFHGADCYIEANMEVCDPDGLSHC